MNYPSRTSITSEICREHWDTSNKRLDPCHKCPLISACHQPTPAGLAAFEKYLSNLNQAALDYSNTRETR